MELVRFERITIFRKV